MLIFKKLVFFYSLTVDHSYQIKTGDEGIDLLMSFADLNIEFLSFFFLWSNSGGLRGVLRLLVGIQ